jgi:thymidylate kinase
MNKLIIICGGDQLGKSSLIKGLCEYFNYKNITLRHCDKPPANLNQVESVDFQFKCFYREGNLINFIFDKFNETTIKYHYCDNIIMYDRFHLGEYVYGQMFRKVEAKFLKAKLLFFEKSFLNYPDVNLITLTSDPEFFLEKEDGNSFSKNLEEKTKELELFKEAHEFSSIKNKTIIKVDNIGIFRPKEDILKEALTFLYNDKTP